MPSTYTCTHCHRPVARTEAVLRGNAIDELPRAWHPECFLPSQVPAQRSGAHDAPMGTLAERLAWERKVAS